MVFSCKTNNGKTIQHHVLDAKKTWDAMMAFTPAHPSSPRITFFLAHTSCKAHVWQWCWPYMAGAGHPMAVVQPFHGTSWQNRYGLWYRPITSWLLSWPWTSWHPWPSWPQWPSSPSWPSWASWHAWPSWLHWPWPSPSGCPGSPWLCWLS